MNYWPSSASGTRGCAELPLSCPWYAVNESNWGDQRLSHKNPGANQVIALDKRMKLLMTLAGT